MMSRAYNGRQVLDDDRLHIIDEVYSDPWVSFKIYAKRQLSNIYDEDDVADAFRLWEVFIKRGIVTRTQVRAYVLRIINEGIDKREWHDSHAISLLDDYSKDNT